LFELEDSDIRIPEGKLEYLRQRTKNNQYSYFIRKFHEEQRIAGLTNAKLARRIGCDPGRLSKLLGAPGNWTIATVSDLLAGIAGEELDPASRSPLKLAHRNYRGPDWLRPESKTVASASLDPSTTETRSTAAIRPKSHASVECLQ